MDTDHDSLSLANVAAAIAEPARARMLCCLLDGRARTSTELAMVGAVSPSTASAHLARLQKSRLVDVLAQGKHRYFRLSNTEVAAALEALLAISGADQPAPPSSTPQRLRLARTCYDHMAGSIAVALHDRLLERALLAPKAGGSNEYAVSDAGAQWLHELGIDLAAAGARRRKLACTCLDWSERRPHLGGALGAALLDHFLRHGWAERDLDSRQLAITRKGRTQFERVFGVAV
jgi:DNA-binding transcriptional ArsR family regulator